jgi:hypothetical protein
MLPQLLPLHMCHTQDSNFKEVGKHVLQGFLDWVQVRGVYSS